MHEIMLIVAPRSWYQVACSMW